MKAFTLLCLLMSASLAAAPAPVVFTHVTVVPMDDASVLADRHVFLRDGRIERIVPAVEAGSTEGYTVIAARGRYLLPGLAEMHAHIPGVAQREFAEDVLTLYVAHGVTTIRGMLGEPWHLELRDAVARGDVLGPRIYTAGPSFNGNSVESPAQAARMVAEQVDAGYDFLKLHPGLEREEFDAIVATARELGIEFSGHVSSAVGVPRALAARQRAIDHQDGYIDALVAAPPGDRPAGFFGFNLVDAADEGRIPGLARATRQGGVWIVPTETIMLNALSPEPPDVLAARPEMAYLPAELVERWTGAKRSFLANPHYGEARAERFFALRRALLAEMHAAGVELLLGSDSPQFFNVPGFSIYHELEAMRAAGLSNHEVLRSGTVNVARFYGAESRYGAIREGLEADLVLLEDNPLESLETLQRPAGVVLRGLWLDREMLDQRLAAIRARRHE